MKRLFLPVLLILALCLPAYAAKPITPTGWHQGDVVEAIRLLANFQGNKVLSDPDFHKTAAGSATFDVGNTFSYLIGGRPYTKAALDTVGGLTATAQATGTDCLYLISINAAGTLAATKGTAVAYGSTPAYPATPANSAVVAALRVAIGSTAAGGFTLGTTAFNYAPASSTITLYGMGFDPNALADLEALIDY